jgi:hypothetical protein
MTRSRLRGDLTWRTSMAPWRLQTASQIAVVMAVFMACVCGCRSTNEQRPGEAGASKPAPAPSEQQASEIRQQLMAADPNVLIGEVLDVVPESQMAAVGNVDASRFKVHDVLVFIDGAKQPQSTGEVQRIANGQLIVRYEPLQKGNRAPRLGDLAVRAQ